MYYIYLTTNLINGKKYIGQHQGEINDGYLGSGVHLKQALNKYGKENFKKEIIEICNTEEELNEREKYWINKFDAVNNKQFYNVSEGGQGRNTRGENHPLYGKHHTDEAKKKMSEAKRNNPEYMEYFINMVKEKHPKNRIKMYDKNKNYIRTFESQLEVVKFLGQESNHTQRLRAAINNHTIYHGYLFLDEDTDINIVNNTKEEKKIGTKLKIDMYDKNENFIKTFNSKKEVLDFLGLSKATQTLTQKIEKHELYHDYYFKYHNLPII